MIRQTSKAARASIRKCAPGQRRKILAALAKGPLHDEELCGATGLNPSSLRPRRLELIQSGDVCAADGTRQTRSGRKAQLWTVAK